VLKYFHTSILPYFHTCSQLSDQNNSTLFKVNVTQIVAAFYHPDVSSNWLGFTIQVSVPTRPIALAAEDFLSKPVIHVEIINGLHSHHHGMEAVIDPIVVGRKCIGYV